SQASKVLLIISDGEDHGESYSAALNALMDQNVSVYTMGIGTASGGTIPIYNDSGSLKGYKRDNEGEVVTTRLMDDILLSIADDRGSKYYEINNSSKVINVYLGRLDEREQSKFSSK